MEEQAKSDEEWRSDIHESMFYYQERQLNELAGIITETRNIANYIVTGAVAFTGFVLNNNLTSVRKTIIGIGVITLFWFWFYKINVSISLTSGLNALESSKIEYSVNHNSVRYINSKKDYWIHLLNNLSSYYESSYSELQKLLNAKDILFRLTIVYLIIILVLLILPVFDISNYNFFIKRL